MRSLVLIAIIAMAIPSETPAFAAAAPPVLTTVAAVHDLPPEEAAKSRAVHLVATVTYYNRNIFSLFVADATGSGYAYLATPADLHQGDLVDIVGVTQASYRTIIFNPTVKVIGKGTLPAASPAGYPDLMSGGMDCRYVKIRGTVRSATRNSDLSGTGAQLQILVPGGVIGVTLDDDTGIDLPGLIDAEVEASGVAGGIFNGRKQLIHTQIHVIDRRELNILRLPKIRPTDLPLTSIGDVLPTQFILDRSRRVRVRGTVVFYEPGNSVVIQNADDSLVALTREIDPIRLGAVVDVIGFADGHGAGPMLEEAEIFPTGEIEAVSPRPLSYDEALAGKYSDSLITLRGTVLSELHDKASDSMVIMVDQHPVNVLLWTTNRPALPDLEAGTMVAVTGIDRTSTTGLWNELVIFRLDLREVGDVKVSAPPSWWTVAHMLYILGALLSISVVITGWALALRRRVSMQRERIEHTMRMERERSRLLEQINSELPLGNLLEDICSTMGALISDVQCSCELLAEDAADPAAKPKTQDPDTLFEAVLTGTTGHQVGVFLVKNAVSRSLSKEEQETLAIGASLSNLAVNQRHLYQRLNYHSTHDQLTALPNRRLSDMHLEEALRAAMQGGQRIGVVYIDVDQFKQVNDKHGHKTGDLYLQQIAMRLNAMVRARDLLARIGGDEFLLTAELSNLQDGEAYKTRLQSCFDECFVLDGVTIYGSASIGLAVFPDHGTTAAELQRHADMEMYAAKQNDRVAVFASQARKQRVAS